MRDTHSKSIAFLKWWLPKGPWCLTAIHPEQQAAKRFLKAKVFNFSQEAEAIAWLDQHSDHNLYYTVNQAKTGGKFDRPAREDLAALVGLHADVDPRSGEDLASEQVRIYGLLTQDSPKGLPRPSAVIFTGGGYQVLWKLRTPTPIRDAAHADDLARYNLQIRNLLEGDAAQDVSRILRLPGTMNWPSPLKLKKGRTAAVAEVVQRADALTATGYDLKDFIQAPEVQSSVERVGAGPRPRTRPQVAIGGNIRRIEDVNAELPDTVPGPVKVIIVQGDNPDNFDQFAGDRSKAVWYVACELVRQKVADETIFSILTDPDFGISGHVLAQPRAEKYALRQIERAHEYAIDPDLRAFNERYSVITNFGGRCRVIEEVYDEQLNRATLTTLSFEDFRNAWLHQRKDLGGDSGTMALAEWWLRHTDRRQYDRVVFRPKQDEEVGGNYNLWRGFGVEPRPGECGLFLQHVLRVVCAGQEDHYDYVMGWMANAVQNPDQPGQVALVLKGRMGTGKSFFARTLGRLFGRHYLAVSDSKRLVSNFNSHLRDCVLMFADEAFYAGDKKHESILKALITEDVLAIEAKGKDIEMSANCLHIIMASNEDWAVPASMDDRRFFVLEVKDAQRNAHKHFASMQSQLDDRGFSALLDFLLRYDISKFNVRDRPETMALMTEKAMSLGPVEAYWYECLRNGELGLLDATNIGWPQRVPKAQVFDEVRRRSANQYGRWNNIALGILFTRKLLPPGTNRDVRISGTVVWRDSQGNERTATNTPAWDLPPLAVCRKWWVRRFGKPLEPWPDQPEDVVPDYLDGRSEPF